MKKLLLLPLLALLFGCASFSTNTFRTEQSAVSLVYGAYVGYTNYLVQFPGQVTPGTQAAVKDARLKFAASVGTLESLRAAYETNSAVQPQVTAMLMSLNDQASNIVWLVQFIKNGGK